MQEQVQSSIFTWRGSPPKAGLPRPVQRHAAGRFALKYLTLLILVFTSITLKAQDPGLEWAKAFQGTGASLFPSSIAKDANGNVYFGGVFEGTFDFDPGPGIFNITGPAGRTSLLPFNNQL